MEFEIDDTWVTTHSRTPRSHRSWWYLHVFHLYSPFWYSSKLLFADDSSKRRSYCIVAQSLRSRRSRNNSGVDDNPPPTPRAAALMLIAINCSVCPDIGISIVLYSYMSIQLLCILAYTIRKRHGWRVRKDRCPQRLDGQANKIFMFFSSRLRCSFELDTAKFFAVGSMAMCTLIGKSRSHQSEDLDQRLVTSLRVFCLYRPHRWFDWTDDLVSISLAPGHSRCTKGADTATHQNPIQRDATVLSPWFCLHLVGASLISICGSR
jgi:hypothetical protein